MVFNFIKFLLYDVKLLTMRHGTVFKSAVPSNPMRQIPIIPLDKPGDVKHTLLRKPIL